MSSDWNFGGSSSGGSNWDFGGGSSAKKKSSGGESTFLGGLFGGIAHTVESAVHPVESAASWLEPDWIKPANNLAANFAQGIYATGRASVVDVKNHPESLAFGPGAPIAANVASIAEGHGGGQLTKKIIEPTAKAYETKYGGLNPWDFRPGDVAHNVREDPFGTALDVAALGTVPFGGEGVAIRGAALSERVGLEETALGRAINTAAKAADEARAPREIAYKPNTAEGGVFQASRARTVQGRYVYNPVREAVGKSFQGRLPVIGNQARFAKYVRQMSDIHLGSEYALLKEFDRTLGAHVLKSKRLTSGERVALDYIPGYGPETAKAAPLGAPRQQLVDFYTAARDQITKTLQDSGLAKGPKTQAKIELKAVSRKLTLLDKHGAEIDQAFKAPRPIMEQALTEAKGVADAMAGWMTEAKLAAPETLAQRPFLEQRLMRGIDPQAVVNETQQRLDQPVAKSVEPGLFHGTRKRFEGDTLGDIYSTGSGANNLYGHGFYTTDAHDIASTYTRKGGATESQHVYRVHWTGEGQPKVLDLAEPAHPTVKGWGEAQLKEADAGYFDVSVESYDELKKATESGSSGEVIRAVRRMWGSTGEIPKAEVDDMVANLSEALSAQGFDGLKHVGGKLAGGGKNLHNVTIFFDTKKLKLSDTTPPAPTLDIPLDSVPLEHPDAFYRPHTGPPLKNDASAASGWRGGPNQAPGVSKQNTGYRFSTGQTESGGNVWTKAGQQVLKYRSISDQIERLRPVMVPYDGGLEHPLLPGYTPVNPDGVALSRGQREVAPADEQLHGLTSVAEHAAIDKHLNTLFPPESGGTVAQFQIPKGLADRIKGDYSRAGIVTRNLFDRPLAVWKALVLKNRPAWLINNLFGQHVLLLLHNGLHWTDYVQSLRPEKRRQLEKGIHGILQSGTTRLAGGASFTGGRRERAMAGYYGKGPRAAALAGKGVTTVLGAWGNGIAKLNQELADNVPRTTLARRYVREQKHVMRRLEVAHGAVESAVKGKTIEEVAQLLSPEQKAEILRKVNLFLGDFNSLGGASGRRVRRVLPFAAWFKVILRITQDLAMDHPEKLVLVKNLEAASAKDPSVDPGIDLPSWLQGSLLAAYAPGGSAPGTEPLLSTTAINPFQTPVQLTQQVSSLFKKGTPTATDNPVASLGPLISAINLAQGVDPFYGGTYAGPGASSSPVGRAIAGTITGLPEYRLLQAGRLAPGYTPTKSYHDTYVNVNGHQVPLDALLRYFGYPLRRVDKKAAATYAKQGR